MTYETAIKLKNAGYWKDKQMLWSNESEVIYPPLEELIERCEKESVCISTIYREEKKDKEGNKFIEWVVWAHPLTVEKLCGYDKSLDEAVAKLWLALNPEGKNNAS